MTTRTRDADFLARDYTRSPSQVHCARRLESPRFSLSAAGYAYLGQGGKLSRGA